MKYLVIDGNSIINRAFYGIKLLNAKDGHFTNAIYGFMNILLHLDEKYSPDAIIAAFDVHAPTFRHKMYDEYKAGRKGAPHELIEQFEPLKVLLKAYGCSVVECPGFEADDILGTLSVSIKDDDHCYIATGDRDSLQLIKKNVSVLLTTTKAGKTQTVEYNEKLLFDEYGVSPEGMIEIKALQGDSSDNIPGVAGIGPKTAGELIKKYGNIDVIYENIDNIEATASVKSKLISGKENAFFSRKLGTIALNAPINTNMSEYLLNKRDSKALINELIKHEMFKMIDRLELKSDDATYSQADKTIESDLSTFNLALKSISEAEKLIENCEVLYFTAKYDNTEISYISLLFDNNVIIIENKDLFFDDFIRRIFNSERFIITDDCKQIFNYLIKKSYDYKNVIFDIKLAAYLLDVNSSDYSVNTLAMSYNVKSSAPIINDNDTAEFFESDKSFCEAAILIKVLSDRLKAVISERDQLSLLTEIEIPLAFILASMENAGMKVDIDGINKFSDFLTDKINETEEKIFSIAGESFNINSPKQLGVILFEKLAIPTKKKTKTGYSTSADVLEALSEEYPIVSLVLEYRAYSKLKSTYCDGLIKAADNDSRVRCTFNQTETRTGRLSSTEPNLQNIPVRTPLGREMRKFFIAEEGCKIIDADYSQIELRVLAALSDDKNMIEAFNSEADIHSLTASKVFGIPLEQVTSDLRSKAKAVNFGIVYGIGAFSLAKDIKTSRAEAEAFIKSYLSLYSSVQTYMDKCIAEAKENGYSQTKFFRRRYLPELSSSNGMMRAFGERVARNMPIQGTAADIIKIAMIRVFYRLKEEFPDAKLIMQVHDELMAEAPEKDAENVARLIKEEMENAVELSVKLSADTAIGDSWYDAKD